MLLGQPRSRIPRNNPRSSRVNRRPTVGPRACGDRWPFATPYNAASTIEADHWDKLCADLEIRLAAPRVSIACRCPAARRRGLDTRPPREHRSAGSASDGRRGLTILRALKAVVEILQGQIPGRGVVLTCRIRVPSRISVPALRVAKRVPNHFEIPL